MTNTPRLTSHVDPFIGIDGGGNCLCGPYLPLSLVRLGPDTLAPQQTNGYRSSDPIVRFTHTHVSGTGGGGRYGNIGITPFTGKLRLAIDPYERENEEAAAGYYAVTLQPAGIRAELTTTPRAGVHRYIFPEGAEANILLDASAVNQRMDAAGPGIDTGLSTGGCIEFITDTEIVGHGDFRGGWGHSFPYSVYFYLKSDRPFLKRGIANYMGMLPHTSADGAGCRALAGFGEGGTVTLVVGISNVSIANARAHAEAGGMDFDTVRAEAVETWEKSLSRIRVEGGTEAQRTLFYTLFTRLVCMPGDLGIDDEFSQWHSGVRHFSDYYCLWDSVRNANSFIGLFDPDLEVAMLNCLLDIADHNGWLPDAWVAGHSAQIQGGSSADILFCEAALKGLPGIDYEKALRQMRKNNEVESPNPLLYGRFLPDYRDLGFVSSAVKNCVSRHLEYSYQDWCIGRLAEHLGQQDVAKTYYENSGKIWNLWREDLKCFGPKNRESQWVETFDPACCLPDSWNDPFFYEGTSRQWSFSAHHDFAELVARHGGDGAFVAHLDEFFDKAMVEPPKTVAGLRVWDFYDSKETMLHVPYLYIYAGRPDKTAERVRWAMGEYFNTSRRGLADNEDMGCQSAFYMCSALGIYPVMGQDIYWLTTPVFERSEIALGTSGNMLVIEAPGAGADNPYIGSATLNGEALERAWLRHFEIAGGATLRLELSVRPTDWGRAQRPPSPMSEQGGR